MTGFTRQMLWGTETVVIVQLSSPTWRLGLRAEPSQMAATAGNRVGATVSSAVPTAGS